MADDNCGCDKKQQQAQTGMITAILFFSIIIIIVLLVAIYIIWRQSKQLPEKLADQSIQLGQRLVGKLADYFNE